MDSSELLTARHLLEDAEGIFVLTGAGLSAEAGLPTYRGEKGLWSQVDPSKFTSFGAFENDPRTVWEMCSEMREKIRRTEPSSAHRALARLALDRAAANGRVTLVTQNVDGFHDRAAREVASDDPAPARAAELHGNLWRILCLQCSHRFEHRRVLDPDEPPACPECGGRTRPDIVWFGEEPHRPALLRAVRSAQACELCLVVGTSVLVAPASKLPTLAASHGARLIEINPQPTPLTGAAAVSLRMGAGEALERLV